MGTDARIQRERDLFLRLLEMGHERELAPLLEQALSLAVEATGAERGYIELCADKDGATEWSMSRGCSEEDVAQIRSAMSRGIVAETLATGGTVHTPSALLDERFANNASVRGKGIEAVLCTPLGAKARSGVLYLQGRTGAGPFADADVALAETFARHISPALMRLAQLQRSREDSDPTKVWRQKLRSTERMIGRSPAVAESLRHISVYALNDLPLLLLGPSGSGKTHAARIIHDNGPRRHGPYIELNCADLIRTLQATELFGTLKGTHSTATEDILGAVDRAAGGTLFLDELAELDLAVQSSLLKFIEQGIYSPGQGVVKKADVRVIIATNAQLEERVTEGRFRNDLFQRVKMFQIRFPGLAERREDILPLAEYFLGVYSSDQKLSLSPAAEEAILATEWPGNTRDLSNVVKRGLAFAKMEQAGQIEPRHLFPDERERPRNELSYQEQTRIFQRELLLRTLQATSWNISEAAKRLDITRAHVYNLINSFGLESGKKASSPARKG